MASPSHDMFSHRRSGLLAAGAFSARDAGVDDDDRPGGDLGARAVLHDAYHFVAQGGRPIGDPFARAQDMEVRAANAGPRHPHQGLTQPGEERADACPARA